MTTQLILLAILVVLAPLSGVAIAHFTRRKPTTKRHSQPESNIDAARRRAAARATARAEAPASPPLLRPTPAPPNQAGARISAGTLRAQFDPPPKSHQSIEMPTGITVTLVHTGPPVTQEPAANPAKGTPDKDAWEEWATPEFDPYTSGHAITTTLDVHYVDSKGQSTVRQITTERYTHNGHDGLLHAYCHMRKSRRSFRIAQITKATSVETGEIIEHLPMWLDEQYAQSDTGQADAFIEEHDAALTALFFVAKADGAYRQPEKRLVADFCEERGCEVADLVIKTMAQWATPSKIGYGKALRALAELPDDYQQQVYEVASQMLSSKKTPRDAEIAALDRMRALLDINNM